MIITRVGNWLFKLWHGVSRDLDMEVDMICKYRFDENYQSLNDYAIKELISQAIKREYDKRKLENEIKELKEKS